MKSKYEEKEPTIGSTISGTYHIQMALPELNEVGWCVYHTMSYIIKVILDTTMIIEVIQMDDTDEPTTYSHVEYVVMAKTEDRMLINNRLLEHFNLLEVSMRHDYLADKYNMSSADRSLLAMMLGFQPLPSINEIKTTTIGENHAQA